MLGNYYKITNKALWTGRVDDEDDYDAFRIHQVVKCIDLQKLDKLELNTELNICLLGFCCDEGIKKNLGRTGAAQGPEYIRKELANLPVSFGKNIKLFDAGDITCENDNLEKAQQHLADTVHAILSKGLFPIVLGGGHELALGNYNGIQQYLNTHTTSVGIINFDAHFDLRPHENGGSSGTMFSQIAETCNNNNREFSYLCLGIQTYANTKSLFKKANKLGTEYILAKDFTKANFSKIEYLIESFVKKHEHIYLSLCTDVFNAAHAPGVSSLQPFGMDPETVLYFLKKIIECNKTVSFDIAEVSPRFDHDLQTAKLAAVIIYAIINSLQENINQL